MSYPITALIACTLNELDRQGICDVDFKHSKQNQPR